MWLKAQMKAYGMLIKEENPLLWEHSPWPNILLYIEWMGTIHGYEGRIHPELTLKLN